MHEPVAEPERGSRWWIWLLVALAVVAIGVGAWYLFADRVTVPNVVGREASEAADILHDEGLEVAFVNEESDDVPRDEVIKEDPKPGEEVREGTTITLTVSGGRGTVAVPAVEGQSREEAEQALTEAGFKVDVEEAFSESVPEGDVISQSPEGGRQATKGRTVTITVSQGVEGIEVPNLTGQQREAAEQQLNDLGLTADITEEESTGEPGTVTEQDPAAGTSVEKGAAVKLTVAKQRPEVPDVTTGNPTVEEATQTLEEAGFKVATDPRPDPALVGRVIDQRPEAGTLRSTGGTVTLVVGEDETAAEPTPTP